MARFLLAALFLHAGLTKLAARRDFAVAVANYRLLPAFLTGQVARWLPWLEIGVGLLLALGVATGPALLTLGALLLAFSAAVAINLLRGRLIDCGCVGAAPKRISWAHVARNLALAALAAATAARPPVVLSLWPGWQAAAPRHLASSDGMALLITASATVMAGSLLVALLPAITAARVVSTPAGGKAGDGR